MHFLTIKNKKSAPRALLSKNNQLSLFKETKNGVELKSILVDRLLFLVDSLSLLPLLLSFFPRYILFCLYFFPGYQIHQASM